MHKLPWTAKATAPGPGHWPGPGAVIFAKLLVGRGLVAGRGLLAELALEARHPAAGVKDLLLARVERVAVRAHVGVDDAAARRGSRGEGVPAGAGHRRH